MSTDQNTCQPVLELVNLGKKIRKKQIVKNIYLSLNPSEVYGFLGPNGAGKTTTDYHRFRCFRQIIKRYCSAGKNSF